MSAAPQRIDELVAEGESHAAAGRLDTAESCAMRALEASPQDPRAHLILAAVSLARGRAAEALERLQPALQEWPREARYHYAHGRALAGVGRAEEAIAAFQTALRYDSRHFEARRALGIALEGRGRRQEAAEAYRAALEIRPRDEAVLVRLGVCELMLRQTARAIDTLSRAREVSPDNPRTLNNLAWALIRTGEPARAIELLERAVALDPGFIEAWVNLAEQHYVARNDARALECFDRVAELDPQHEFAFLRQAVRGEPVERAPDRFVATYFDRFARTFDQRLTGELAYRAPQVAADMLAPWLASRSGLQVADLGCGTGLSGQVVRSHAAYLAGIDLSQKMLEQAATKKVYDELFRAEITAFLQSAAGERFDLILALDVLVYIGSLDALAAQAHRTLRPGGRWLFSVERLEGGDSGYRVMRSARFAHSREYVLQVAAAAGFTLVEARDTWVRHESSEPVASALYLLERR